MACSLREIDGLAKLRVIAGPRYFVSGISWRRVGQVGGDVSVADLDGGIVSRNRRWCVGHKRTPATVLGH